MIPMIYRCLANYYIVGFQISCFKKVLATANNQCLLTNQLAPLGMGSEVRVLFGELVLRPEYLKR